VSGGSGRRGRLFWVSAAPGWAVIGWGVRWALHHHIDTRSGELGRFFIGGTVVRDFIFAPLVLSAGFGLARLVPGRSRAPVQAALLLCGCATVFTWPEIRDYARINHNPSSLPHNYTADVLVVTAAVFLAIAIVTAVAAVRRKRSAG
jgi:hypothetical protein